MHNRNHSFVALSWSFMFCRQDIGTVPFFVALHTLRMLNGTIVSSIVPGKNPSVLLSGLLSLFCACPTAL